MLGSTRRPSVHLSSTLASVHPNRTHEGRLAKLTSTSSYRERTYTLLRSLGCELGIPLERRALIVLTLVGTHSVLLELFDLVLQGQTTPVDASTHPTSLAETMAMRCNIGGTWSIAMTFACAAAIFMRSKFESRTSFAFISLIAVYKEREPTMHVR